MVRRRSLIGGAALLPFAAWAAKGAACTIAAPTAEVGAAQIARVERLFGLWWARDEAAFLRAFLGAEGELLSDEAVLSMGSETKLAGLRELFGSFFFEGARHKELMAMTSVDADVFVACVEHAVGGLAPDCSGAPTTHLFLLSFRGAAPSELHHIKSASSFATGQVLNWAR